MAGALATDGRRRALWAARFWQQRNHRRRR